MRDDFSNVVKGILAARVNNRCSNPRCRQPTSGPQIDPEKALNVGVASHMTAASPDGPRYDPTLTSEQRKHPDNGIWLCQKCGKLVDNDAARYTVELLREWKRSAEELALQEVEGRQPPLPDTGVSAASARFEQELAGRQLDDPQRPAFAKTKYGAKLGWVNERRVIGPLPVTGMCFACLPERIVADAEKDGLLRWMDCNQRRYDPCRERSFIPSPSYVLLSKGYLWDNASEIPVPPPAKVFTRYLAIEPAGWIEYGFDAGAPWEDDTDRVYYAKVVAAFVGFLSFVRDLSARFQIDTKAIGLGLALVGTSGKQLLCIREEGIRQSYHTQPPSSNAMRFVRPPGGEDWTVDAVAQEAAIEILDHWSFAGEFWVGRPEFKDGVYHGEFFKSRFQGWL